MSDLRQRLLAAFQLEQREHLQRLRSFLELLEREGAPAPAEFQDALRSAHTLKGAARAVDLPVLEAIAHQLESLMAGFRKTSPEQELVAWLRGVLDAIEDYAGRPGVEDRPPPVETLEQLQKLVSGEAVQLARPRPQAAPAVREQGEAFVRVPVSVLEALAATSARLTAEVARRRDRDFALDQLCKELGHQVRKARMIPAEDVLADMGAVARELAASQGKQVDFHWKGREVEVDRQVLLALREPLLHMVRNAVAHGVEKPGERKRAGKSEAGNLELRLEVDRGRLVVSLADDGRGIELDEVRERAGQLGLQPVESEEELLEFLFLAEFTTAGKAGRLAGRGLGLSVVERTARRLQGRASIARRSPWGTVVTLESPLSVTSQQLVLVGCGKRLFGLPSHSVLRLTGLPAEALEASRHLVEGRLVPVTFLAQALGFAEGGSPGWAALVRTGQRQLLLAVDELLGFREAPVTPLEVAGYENPALSGAVLLEDGRICLVVSPEQLKPVPVVSAPAPESAPAGPGRVLVVDDSITTRMLEKSVLEAHGYQVVVALDGQDALKALRLHQVDLVISDIQMPEMDGFELLTAIKADPTLRHLPVILLTSKADREDMQRGLDLGAEAYLSKQTFDQTGLLETVRQVL